MSIENGASAFEMHGYSVVLLATNTVAPFVEGTGFSVGAQPGATATLQCAFCAGRFDGSNALSSTGTIIGILPQAFSGPGPSIATGSDFRLGTFSIGALATNGVTAGPGALFRIGRTFLSDSATGLTVTPTGSVGSSATIAAGGSGYVTSGYPVNATDNYGGIWKMTISGGAVSSVTMLSAPYVSSATPGNPIALNSPSGQPGTGATINVTWATGTGTNFVGTIASNGTAGVNCTGAPTAGFVATNGIVTHC
jgi:hypothetical protein